MEKHHFKDRSEESTKFDEIFVGEPVLICEKEMQQTAKTIDDLTMGYVMKKLTKRDHPRGIKVMIQKENGEITVGRVVYLIRDGEILRRNIET